MKKIILLLVFVICLFGCAKTGERAEAYLENKYGEDFTLYSSDFDHGASYSFTTDSHPGVYINVFSNNGKYTDNYYGYLIKDKYTEKVNNVITNKYSFTKTYLNLNSSTFDEHLANPDNLDQDFEDYNYWFKSNMFVFLREDDSFDENDFESLKQILLDNKIHGFISIYKVPTDDYYSINSNNYLDYLSDHYYLKTLFRTTLTD